MRIYVQIENVGEVNIINNISLYPTELKGNIYYIELTELDQNSELLYFQFDDPPKELHPYDCTVTKTVYKYNDEIYNSKEELNKVRRDYSTPYTIGDLNITYKLGVVTDSNYDWE
jgi:hypothetical protein